MKKAKENIKRLNKYHVASRSPRPRNDKQINIANLRCVFSTLVCRREEDERRKMRKIFGEGKYSSTEEKKNGEEKEGKNWKRKIFSPQSRRRTEKEKEENLCPQRRKTKKERKKKREIERKCEKNMNGKKQSD